MYFVEIADLDRVIHIIDILNHLGLGRRAPHNQRAKWSVQMIEYLGRAPVARAEHGNPRAREILLAAHRTQELRIHRYAEIDARALARGVFKNRGDSLIGGCRWNRATNDNGDIVIDHG